MTEWAQLRLQAASTQIAGFAIISTSDHDLPDAGHVPRGREWVRVHPLTLK